MLNIVAPLVAFVKTNYLGIVKWSLLSWIFVIWLVAMQWLIVKVMKLIDSYCRQNIGSYPANNLVFGSINLLSFNLLLVGCYGTLWSAIYSINVLTDVAIALQILSWIFYYGWKIILALELVISGLSLFS
jgi:hypothetical protein